MTPSTADADHSENAPTAACCRVTVREVQVCKWAKALYIIQHTLTRWNTTTPLNRDLALTEKRKETGDAAFNPQKHQNIIIIIIKKKIQHRKKTKQNFAEWHIYMCIMITRQIPQIKSESFTGARKKNTHLINVTVIQTITHTHTHTNKHAHTVDHLHASCVTSLTLMVNTELAFLYELGINSQEILGDCCSLLLQHNRNDKRYNRRQFSSKKLISISYAWKHPDKLRYIQPGSRGKKQKQL